MMLNEQADVIEAFRTNADAMRKDLAELSRQNELLTAQVADLTARLNTPELIDFAAGVVSEAQHQRHRWGTDHEAGKSPSDWFWLVGYLAGKANMSHAQGDTIKALHHTITAAAALANWHAAILGQTNMRPGSDPVVLGVTNWQ